MQVSCKLVASWKVRIKDDKRRSYKSIKDFIILHREQHGCDVSTLNALDIAIKALEQTEPEKCGDCISRQAMDDAISNLTYWHFENGRLIPGGGGSKAETVYKVDDVTRLTYILPSVTPKPKIGRWMECGGDEPWLKGYCCSLCNFTTTQKYDYCTCGAKMIDPQESEEV